MKPLLVVAFALILSVNALPENIEDIKELPQAKDIEVEAEESAPQTRAERCTDCAINYDASGEPLASFKALPGAVIHTQEIVEECSSANGCVGLKIKDGKIVQRFENINSFNAASAADIANEFQFLTGDQAGAGNVPFWWMNKDSPFKASGGGGFEKSSKLSSSYTSSFGGAGLGSSGLVGAGLASSTLGGANSGFAGGIGGTRLGGAGLGNSAYGAGLASSALGGANSGIASGIGGAGLGSSAYGAGLASSALGGANSGITGGIGGTRLGGAGLGSSTYGAGLASSALGGANSGIAGGIGGSRLGGAGLGSSTYGTGFSGLGAGLTGSAATSGIAGGIESQTGLVGAGLENAALGGSRLGASIGGASSVNSAGLGYGSNSGFAGTTGYGAGYNGGSAGSSLNLGANPFLNGGVSKFAGATNVGIAARPASPQQTYQASSVNLAKNPFLSGANIGQAQGGYNALYNTNSQNFASTAASKFSGLAGSASSSGANVNLIQNQQKLNEFDFDQQQQQQQNIGLGLGIGGGSVGTGDLQQTCSGEGYACIIKSQCINGVVSGAGLLQASTKKQYCNLRTEVCCRIQVAVNPGYGQDTFGAGSDLSGIYRPGLKPGLGYLPPDNTNSGSNVVSSTVFPRPVVSSPRPFTTAGPTYLPPISSTSAPGYLPPDGEQTINRETIVPKPNYIDGSLILDENRLPRPKPTIISEIPAGCAAALKCTPIEFCTADGVISNTSVILSREQNDYRVPLTDCKDIATGVIGKCCRDPYYTDPWPTNQLGKWVPGVFGGNDGKYVPDNRGSGSGVPPVTARPFSSGSTILNEFIKPTTPIYQGSKGGRGQYTKGGRGQYGQNGQGSVLTPGQRPFVKGQGSSIRPGQGTFGLQGGQGQVVSQGVGTGVSQGFGQGVVNGGGSIYRPGQGVVQGSGTGFSQGSGLGVSQGSGLGVSQGSGFGVGQSTGFGVSQGTGVSQGSGLGVSQGFGQGVTNGGGSIYKQTSGQGVIQGSGLGVSQGSGLGVLQGSGLGVSQGSGLGVSQGGLGVSQGSGLGVSQGSGFGISQGSGLGVSQGSGLGVSQGGLGVSQGSGLGVSQGSGFGVSQGSGLGVSQGSGLGVNQGSGFGISQGGLGVSQGSGLGISQGSGLGISQGFGQGIGGEGQGLLQGTGTGVSQGFGQGILTGTGQGVIQGGGSLISQGDGLGVTQGLVGQGEGFGVSQGFGQGVSQGEGSLISQGAGIGIIPGQESLGFGQGVLQGVGQGVSQGFGQGVSQGNGAYVNEGAGSIFRQGQGQGISQGFGAGIRQSQGYTLGESESRVHRVTLKPYYAGQQCGSLNGQKPFGNHNDFEVDFSEIPWQAMVLEKTNKSLLCGGVITRPDVVITAAACVDGLDAQNVLIKGGEWKLGVDEEPLPFQIVQVKNILVHPFYKRGTYHFDVAILVLSENLRFANNIYPICMPSAQDDFEALYNGAGECIVTGWGKEILQAHTLGSIMHSLNVSLIAPTECQAKLSQDYPHLLEFYDQQSCVCGQPTNPLNNICSVDIGSALACTSGNGHYTLRGVYSWDSGCRQIGNQIGSFYKFDVEWYEWALGLIESVRFSQYTSGTIVTSGRGQIKVSGQGLVKQTGGGSLLQGAGFGPINSITYTEKITKTEPKVYTYTTKPEYVTYTTKPEYVTYTTKPEIVTYTTKPEIVTFTTKPEYFTYTTKPKVFTYTTKPEVFTYTTKPQLIKYQSKPQFIAYETSGSGTDPQYVAPALSFKPAFSDLIKHTHSPTCQCEGK